MRGNDLVLATVKGNAADGSPDAIFRAVSGAMMIH